MGGRFQREGTFVHLQLIHIVVQQETIQHCKAVILQARKRKKKTTGTHNDLDESTNNYAE